VTYVLERLLSLCVEDALFASIVDAQAVEDCFNCGTNADIALSLGGKLDTRHGMLLPLHGIITKLISPQPNQRQAVIQVQGVTMIVTEKRTAFTPLEQFYALDLDPTQFKVAAVKLGYLFPELQAIAADSILAFSPGTISPLVEGINYRHLNRPIYPLDFGMEWKPSS
jgi:microcystin degradation protein MlrC